VNDLPDMDELLRNSERSDRKRYLMLGLILVGAGIALFVGSRVLFSGELTFIAPATVAIGALFIGRAFVRSDSAR
jgi:hypothetical protein